jgi:hypothetical protein
MKKAPPTIVALVGGNLWLKKIGSASVMEGASLVREYKVMGQCFPKALD